jgi:ubiquinone/menaquinone biosynthesis C-methylase UbiE
MTEELEKN